LLAPGRRNQDRASGRYKEILSRLKEAKIETFQLDAPTETASDRELNEETKAAAANRTYSQSVAVTKDVINRCGSEDAEHSKDQARGAGNRRSGSE
jgi:hypothetical protein